MNTLNGFNAISIRLSVPWLGAWFAEVDLDLDTTTTAPTGAATLVIGSTTLTGTIDARASGRFGARAGVRVVGGAGAWDMAATRRHFQNDAGVTISALVSSTAAEIGERVGDLPGDVLTEHYVRVAGPAAAVFGARDWWLDFGGVTQMTARSEIAAPSDLDILSYHPETSTAELAHDEIVRPGWVLKDDRFGSLIVRDVEQTFSQEGARATVWCSPAPQSRFVSALASAVRGLAGVSHLRGYEYRVYGMSSDRVELQSVRAASGAPDLIPVSIWMGLPGARADLAPGSRVLVEFVEGNPARPLVRAFEPSNPPVSLHVDATSAVQIGESGAVVTVGGTSGAAVAMASNVNDALTALATGLSKVAAAIVPHNDPAIAAAADAQTAVTNAQKSLATTKLLTT